MNVATWGARMGAIASCLLLAGDVRAVDVRGSVRSSEEPKTKAIEAVRPPYWHEWNGFIEPKKSGVDYAREVTAALFGPVETRDATSIALKDGTLTPNTIVVQHGAQLRIRNEDDFPHELYVDGLKNFDARSTGPGQTRSIPMDQTGVFVVRDMLSPHIKGQLHVVAKVSVLVNPGPDGAFVFRDVPPGRYTLKFFRGERVLAGGDVEIASTRDVVLDPFAIDTLPAASTGK